MYRPTKFWQTMIFLCFSHSITSAVYLLAYIVYYTRYNTERCSFCFLCFVLTRYVGCTNARVSENQIYVDTGKNVKIVVKHKALVQFRFIAFSTKRFLIEFIDLTSNYLSSYDFVPTAFLMNL